MGKVKLELAGMCVKPFAALLAKYEDIDAIYSLIDKFVQNVLLDGKTNEHDEFSEQLVFGLNVSGDNSFEYEFHTQTVADFIHDYADETTSPRGVEKLYFHQNEKLCRWWLDGSVSEITEMDNDEFVRFMYDNALENTFREGIGLFGLDFADIFKSSLNLELDYILHS